MVKQVRVGDIFEVPIGNGLKVHLQFIGKDETQLYSQVIRVFKKRYKVTEKPTIEDIIIDEIDFYVHLMSIKSGIDAGIWNKIGNHKFTEGEISPIFRSPNDLNTKKIVFKWHVWAMNSVWKEVTAPSELLSKSYMGSTVLNCTDIVEKIQTGKYPFHYPKYPDEE